MLGCKIHDEKGDIDWFTAKRSESEQTDWTSQIVKADQNDFLIAYPLLCYNNPGSGKELIFANLAQSAHKSYRLRFG